MTKQQVETIISDYKKSTENTLCSSSKTFEEFWISNIATKKQILDIRKDFLNQRYPNLKETNRTFLFGSDFIEKTGSSHKQIRKEFLEFWLSTFEEKIYFEVGDEVECLLWGKGVVTEIYLNFAHPLSVTFEKSNKVEFYTLDGRFHEDSIYPVLFHKLPKSHKIQNQPKIISPFKKSELVLVADSEDSSETIAFFHSYQSNSPFPFIVCRRTKEEGKVAYKYCRKYTP